MKTRNRDRTNQFKDDLAWLESNQKMIYEEVRFNEESDTLKESLSRGFRSFLAIVLCIVIPALWYFEWNPSTFFIDKTTEEVTGFFDDGTISSFWPGVVAPLPSLPGFQSPIDEGMIDYVSSLKNQGLLDAFSSPAVRTFYENGVPIEYLTALKQADLIDDFSFPAIVAFYQDKVTINYLQELGESGLLNHISFPAVVVYYKNGVPTGFLNKLKNKDLLDQLSFHTVVDMYNSQK